MDPFLGEIRTISYKYAPKGWALCEGQLLKIADNQALYNLIGKQYGGDGTTTFALPDLHQSTKSANGAPIYYMIALAGIFPMDR